VTAFCGECVRSASHLPQSGVNASKPTKRCQIGPTEEQPRIDANGREGKAGVKLREDFAGSLSYQTVAWVERKAREHLVDAVNNCVDR
jgi:hypothetical protein